MTGSEEPTRAGLDRLHQAMAVRVERGELPGLVTLVAQGDGVAVDAIGVKAFGSDDPMHRDTPFRIASMTKPIVAAATMMLVEDGILTLEEPVDRLLPELANRRVLRRIDGPLDETVPAQRPLTVEDLLTFRLGFGQLVEPTFDPPFPIVHAAADLQLVLGPPDPPTPHAPDEWIKRFGSLPLMFQPGERWQYNVGALVLGVLLARAAGQTLPDLLRTRIFEPLGMQTTGFWLPADVTRRLPSCYTPNFETGQLEQLTVSLPDEWTRAPAFPSGAGGLLSTIDDYLAFARLLLNHGVSGDQRLLSDQSVRMLTTNRLTAAQIAGAGPLLSGSGWGLCMAVTTIADEVSPPGRYGWSGGYGTSWFNDPHHSRIAIVLTQTASVLWGGALNEFDKLADSA